MKKSQMTARCGTNLWLWTLGELEGCVTVQVSSVRLKRGDVVKVFTSEPRVKSVFGRLKTGVSGVLVVPSLANSGGCSRLPYT
ncbi:hypothetical protein JZ751_014881 [Albula glossodonta]|uniref:Uncharacterized protein n=1 Tax=Albula glossodonta TaxID=121402 RepID=A0A8T2N516_9TELE|nr:hypothetical protein JZ751_014881 [Albula glossodonta]